MHQVSLAVQCIYICSDGSEDGKEGRLPSLLYLDDLVLCGVSEEELRVMVVRFVELCRRGVKVNVGESKVMILNGEEGLECGLHRWDSFRACLRI